MAGTRLAPSPGRTEMLCGFVHEGAGGAPWAPAYDAALGSALGQSVADNGGRLGAVTVVPVPGRRPVARILVAGAGSRKDAGADTLRFAAGAAARRAAELKLKGFAIAAPAGWPGGTPAAVSQIIEGARMALYRFDRFKGEKGRAAPVLTVVCPGSARTEEAARTADAAAAGAAFARDAANMPPNECTPAALAGIARRIAGGRTRCRILLPAELKKRGFGGITAVGQGSRNGPRLIVLEYSGGPRGARPVALVGKAVTFDTGGISIKPGASMDEMKFDKCGGCTVLATVRAAAEMRLPVNLVGIVPSVENMPGGGAYRPGDIVRLYSGKTAEIINTDAEGRLILADAIAYAEKHHSPRAIIDLATLTGACVVALGNNVAGMVSSDRRLAARIAESSERTAEAVWELPLNRDYMDMIKSEVADMKNMGTGRAAGAIAAAAFLRNAVDRTPWAHIDIAGVAWTQAATRERPYNPKGATGFGVRLLLDYLRGL